LKILIVSREYPPAVEGGISRRLEKMVPRLLDRGVELSAVSFAGSSIAGEKVYSLAERSKILYTKAGEPAFSDLASLINDIYRLDNYASQVAKRGNFDLIQIEEPVFGPFIKAKIPVAVTVHTTQLGIARAQLDALSEPRQGKRFLFSGTFGALFDSMCLRKTEYVVAVSRGIQDQVARYYGMPRDKIAVVPNGIETLGSNGYAPKSASWDRSFTFTYAGRLVDFKRVDVFIRALDLLKRKASVSRFKAYVAGAGPSLPSLLRLTQELELEDKVEFTGYLDPSTLGGILSKTDVFVNPSTYEGMPIAVFEAAAHECAPVVARISAMTSYLTNRLNCLFFEPGNSEDLAKQLEALYSDRALLHGIQSRAKELARSFNWDTSAEKLILLYENILNSHKERL
jgi:glycosyltransferase involved in cell wall biosynthesis